MLPRVERNTSIVGDFLKDISIKEISCLQTTLGYRGHSRGKKQLLYIAFTILSNRQDY